MLEALQNIEQVAQECGADAYLKLPAHPDEIYETIIKLIQEEVNEE
jgi:hypothetical protein